MTAEQQESGDVTPSSDVTPVGEHEQRVHNLFLDPGWRAVTIEQTGPDGTQVLSMVYFYVCPVCSAVVPDSDQPLSDLHQQYHLDQSRTTDRLMEKAQR